MYTVLKVDVCSALYTHTGSSLPRPSDSGGCSETSAGFAVARRASGRQTSQRSRCHAHESRESRHAHRPLHRAKNSECPPPSTPSPLHPPPSTFYSPPSPLSLPHQHYLHIECPSTLIPPPLHPPPSLLPPLSPSSELPHLIGIPSLKHPDPFVVCVSTHSPYTPAAVNLNLAMTAADPSEWSRLWLVPASAIEDSGGGGSYECEVPGRVMPYLKFTDHYCTHLCMDLSDSSQCCDVWTFVFGSTKE